MIERRRIVVCGGTGQEGSWVLNSLLKKEKWEIFALLMDPKGEDAKREKDQVYKSPPRLILRIFLKSYLVSIFK